MRLSGDGETNRECPGRDRRAIGRAFVIHDAFHLARCRIEQTPHETIEAGARRHHRVGGREGESVVGERARSAALLGERVAWLGLEAVIGRISLLRAVAGWIDARESTNRFAGGIAKLEGHGCRYALP